MPWEHGHSCPRCRTTESNHPKAFARSGGRGQETGDRSQGAGDMGQRTGDMGQQSGGSGQNFNHSAEAGLLAPLGRRIPNPASRTPQPASPAHPKSFIIPQSRRDAESQETGVRGQDAMGARAFLPALPHHRIKPPASIREIRRQETGVRSQGAGDRI